ncbi:MAG: hypothetical protein P1Q69_21450, partial [Candidatus Thorarchaeota archaeon]|nr:hypothetical protein [Candidatus Thorarchaeota archaeon]
MTILKNGIEDTVGTVRLLETRVLTDDFPVESWKRIATTIIDRILDTDSNVRAIRFAYDIRMATLDVMEQEIETPTTLEEYESTIGQVIVEEFGRLAADDSRLIFEVIGHFIALPTSEVATLLRQNGITDSAAIVSGLKAALDAASSPSEDVIEGPSYTKEQLEEMTRSLRFLEKIEHTLEKPIKGMLRAKGLRGMELEKISIEFLLKDRSKLLALEEQVLAELNEKKLRIPDQEEMQRLMNLREEFKSGALTGSEISTSSEIRGQLDHGKSMESLRLDLVWHFTIGVLKNLARIVETYIRSKKDIQRAKTLLKSIYEDSEAQLQFLREEILIDLFSMRLYEMKVIHPELDATTV